MTTSTLPELHIQVLTDRCAGCQECLVRCPTGALTLDSATWTVHGHDSACVGCRQCERTCPFGAIEISGVPQVSPRTPTGSHHPAPVLGDPAETRTGLPDWPSALAEAERCLSCPDPTCIRGCPAHNDIPSFIGALAMGDTQAAHLVLSPTTVLPDICSRVCDQASQCEGACTWALAGGEPVAIGALERFVADHAPVPGPQSPTPDYGAHAPAAGLSVGIIGSGPAGIAAAWDLVEAGATVTVYEQDNAPGGLLRHGIPSFTLPVGVAQRPWEQLLSAGVRLRLGQRIPASDFTRLAATHDALVVCTGAGTPLRPAIAGIDLAGVYDASHFLPRAAAALGCGAELEEIVDAATFAPAGEPVTVVVMGAGNTALDVARSAVRLGARAVCIDWLERRFATARPDELAEAEREGVVLLFATTVDHLTGDDGHVRAALLSHTHQRRASQRPRVHGRAVTRRSAQLVVLALGYRLDADLAQELPGLPIQAPDRELPDRDWIASGLFAASLRGEPPRSDIGRASLQREHRAAAAAVPRRRGLWVAGDALTGPATVVAAMTQGRVAARSVIETWSAT